MASSSTSSVQKSFKYDAFLSFRGEDTRNTFVGHLYEALKQKSIETYKDDEKIKKGKTISDELIRAIEDSRFYVIVFSKNYASSSWCLDELVKIMECQKKMNNQHTAYPVFFDVEPTEVRKQSGAVGAAFTKHGNNESAGKWREALKEAADLAGWELKNTLNGHEAKLVQKIVEEISLELRCINWGVDENLIGIKTRINGVVSSLELGVDDVRMIGIKGMGGAGKTTLARAIYEHISYQFEGYSFVENVREKSTPSMSGLNLLQKQVLSDVLLDQGINVSGVLEGKSMLKKKMCGRKVLIVLDDVDKIEQLMGLAGDRSWFKPGSRIIITTRDAQVLIAHKVNLVRDVDLLDDKEAMHLFSRHAFGREIPVEGYKELSEQVVRYAAGLPLTIKVLGSFLCGKDDLDWKDALERLETIPLNETMNVLELSYIDLEEDYKEIFLDVACILKGWSKDYAIRVLESCGFRARIGLRVLELKSLITISEGGYLGMHDHIEEMGKNIIRRLNPNKPERHSRLWIEEEIADILANDKATQATECMKLVTPYGFNFEILLNSLANMKELRFLHLCTYYTFDEDEVSKWNFDEDEVSKWNFDEDSLHLPNALRFLKWIDYPFPSLPKTFQAKNLVGLEMMFSQMVQPWKDGEEKPFLKLRFLKFTDSHRLRTLDLSVAPNLETLILEHCYGLVEVHFQVTPNLKELRIYHCNRLEKLHMPAESPKLRSLDLSYLSELRTLHLGVTPNLKELHIYNCNRLEKLHMPAECPKLVNLKLNNLKLTTLRLGITPKLETLSLKDCRDLVEIIAPIGCLKALRYLDLTDCGGFESFLLDKWFPLVDFDSLLELYVTMELFGVKSWLTSFYIQHPVLSVGNLEKFISVRNLEISTVTICDFQWLRKLTLEGDIPEVPEFVVQLEGLEELILLSTNIKHLPESICMLKYLKILELKSCWLLEKLPENLGQLQCLEKLILTECMFLRDIPNSICEMKCLKYFHLWYCIQVAELPEEIGRLEYLKELDITATVIRRLPESIYRVKGLRIVGSRRLLESCGFTSEIKTSDDETFCYI